MSMTAAQGFYVCRLQIHDTFRQALANRVFWVMLSACVLVNFFCLGISIEDGESLRAPDDIGLDEPHGHISFAFGAWQLPLFRDGRAMAHFILLVLGEGVFGVIGTLLALVLTAGFVPEFLQPVNATVVLSKPAPRWVLLLGRYLGVLIFLAFFTGFYVFGTWLTLGLRTGFWVNNYLWGLPLLLLQFAAMYSFSCFLGVLTRSNLVCVFGTILFWLACWGMNYGHHMMAAVESDMPPKHYLLNGLGEACYWIMPKPVDMSMILRGAVDAGQTDPQLQKFVLLGAFHPELSVLSSLVFIVVMLFLATQQLASKDY
jgi:ABC-type transport system involved in multi-copper enzyme maturation permease subunit